MAAGLLVVAGLHCECGSWEPVRVMAGIAMGLKWPVYAAENRADSE